MAKRRKGKKGKNSLLGLLLAVIVLVCSYFFGEAEPGKATNTYLGDGEVYVHIIDVGQGSATLIQESNKGILIDTGEADYSDNLVSYINSCGVDELKYVIASHPHSDHIGGMTDVFEAFKVGAVVMPELSEENIPTTRVYENMMEYILDKDMEVMFPVVGDTINLEDISLSFFGPVKQSEDLNNMSLICRVNAFGNKAMVLGDAEKEELTSVYDTVLGEYRADILVMGHHGSRTSVYKPLLNAIDASVAVISCGRDNDYGHPHKEALTYVSQNGMTLYRTDKEGDIVFKFSADGYEKVN
ncbi:MAG: MBL fold metallo-hydrolase [Clostridia bacterium]|nr:MBL fold metallo-hydrolase [Clostridia bacterium]